MTTRRDPYACRRCGQNVCRYPETWMCLSCQDVFCPGCYTRKERIQLTCLQCLHQEGDAEDSAPSTNDCPGDFS